jgi:hypothetical protein
MDDILEPSVDRSAPRNAQGPDDGDSSTDEEDGGPDWTKLPLSPSLIPIISAFSESCNHSGKAWPHLQTDR